jgi:hypothetical protein
MGNPAILLAAIMFVTILGMGIGNLLMTCAEIAGGLRQPLPERIQLSWIVLLPRAMRHSCFRLTLWNDSRQGSDRRPGLAISLALFPVSTSPFGSPPGLAAGAVT